MTVLSLIPSSVRKVQSSPFLAFPSAQTNMAATKSHSPVIHPYEALAVSEPLPAHGPGTHYKMPWPEIHRAWLSHAGKAFIHRSAHALFIRQKKIFGRGGQGPDKSSFFISLKALARRQLPPCSTLVDTAKLTMEKFTTRELP